MLGLFAAGGEDAVLLGGAPDGTGLVCIVDLLAPKIAAPFLDCAMGGAHMVLPGATTERRIPEFAIVEHHIQGHVTVGTDEVGEGEGTSTAAGKAGAVGNVAVVGQLASAVAVGAGAGGGEGGSHGLFGERGVAAPDEIKIRSFRRACQAMTVLFTIGRKCLPGCGLYSPALPGDGPAPRGARLWPGSRHQPIEGKNRERCTWRRLAF